MHSIDINCDMGEGIGNDEKIMPFISSCNIACGVHAGSHKIMQETIDLAMKYSVKIGAHPSYPDRENFGRKVIDISTEELVNSINSQIKKLKHLLEGAGAKLNHVKPHGALYNEASRNPEVAQAVISAVADVNPEIILYAPPRSILTEEAESVGMNVKFEAFTDRAYESNYQLVSRALSGAVLHDKEEIGQRMIRMIKNGKIECIDGEVISMEADTICIHVDNPEATAIVQHLYRALKQAGVSVL